MITLPKVYPVVDRAAWVERLTAIGVRLIQLRIKDQPEPVLRREIRTATAACAAHGATLVVNDYWRLAIEEDCVFLHLGQEDLDDADLPAIRRAGLLLGVSTHSHDELDRALTTNPDYIALGPVYPTMLKQMPWAPQGLERIGEWRRLIGNRPLVAIGGLTLERLPLVLRAGADSAAVVSDILGAADPEARVRDWLATAEAS